LDQLIEGHHAAAHADGPGSGDAGPHVADTPHFNVSVNPNDVVVMGHTSLGQEGELPVLVTEPRIAAVRMHPGQPKTVVIMAWPRDEWANLEDFRVQLATEVEGLTIQENCGKDCSNVTVSFQEADDYDDEDYPVQGEVQAFAHFKGHPETRMLKLP